MGTFTKQSDINEAGILLFRGMGEGVWTTRDRDRPDVHIDFEIELRSQNEPTGATAYIQLKSAAAHHTGEDCMVIAIKKKHLRYYSELSRQPVFLVLADLKSRRCVYLFVQEWIDRTNALTTPSKSKTIQVHVPLSNDLQFAPKFRADVRRAWTFMREKNPGSPEAALANLRREYLKVDSRFDYKISVGETGRTIRLQPKEAVSLNLKILGDDSPKYWGRIQELNAYGKQPDLSGALIALSGSPLFENINGLQLKIGANSRKGEIVFTGLKRSPYTAVFSGVFSGGKEGVLFESDVLGSPIKFSARLPFEKLNTQGPFGLNIQYDFKRWGGLSVHSLPFFNGLLGLALNAEEKSPVRFIFSCENLPIGEGVLNFEDEFRTVFSDALPLLNLISEVQEISRWSRTELRLPANWNVQKAEVQAIELAHVLTQGHSHVARRHPFTARFGAQVDEKWSGDAFKGGTEDVSIETEQMDFSFEIFGKRITVPYCRHRFTNVKIFIEYPGKDSTGDDIMLVLRSSEGGTHEVFAEKT